MLDKMTNKFAKRKMIQIPEIAFEKLCELQVDGIEKTGRKKSKTEVVGEIIVDAYERRRKDAADIH